MIAGRLPQHTNGCIPCQEPSFTIQNRPTFLFIFSARKGGRQQEREGHPWCGLTTSPRLRLHWTECCGDTTGARHTSEERTHGHSGPNGLLTTGWRKEREEAVFAPVCLCRCLSLTSATVIGRHFIPLSYPGDCRSRDIMSSAPADTCCQRQHCHYKVRGVVWRPSEDLFQI